VLSGTCGHYHVIILGKWIVLRVSSSCRGDKDYAGCAWCAIEIGNKVDDPRVFIAEYGWQSDRGWAAFPITRVKVFKKMKVSQYGESRPFVLAACDETTELMNRLLNLLILTYMCWVELLSKKNC